MPPPSPPLRPSSIEEKDDCYMKTESKTKLDAPIAEEDEDDWCMDIASIESIARKRKADKEQQYHV